MAATAQGATITRQHEVRQARISAVTAYFMLRAFRLLDPLDIEGTTARWLRFVIPGLRRQHDLSVRVARQYVQEFRRVEAPAAPPLVLPPPPEFNIEQITTSLVVTGPRELQRKVRQHEEASGAPVSRENPVAPFQVDRVAKKTTGASTRVVGNAGREAIYEAVVEDDRRTALGWIRKTDSDPCSFCALLASRGPVYLDDSFEASDLRFHGPGNAKVHDHCGCSLEPIYNRKTDIDPRVKEWDALWRQVSGGKSNAEALNEFRRHFEGREDGRRLR